MNRVYLSLLFFFTFQLYSMLSEEECQITSSDIAQLPLPEEMFFWRKQSQTDKDEKLLRIIKNQPTDLARIKTLLLAKANVNVRDYQYNTILHYASSMCNTTVIQTLLDADTDVNARNKDLETPLHLAAGKSHKEAVILLLTAKADPNIQNRLWSNSPLHEAAKIGNLAIIQYLLDNNANSNTKNKIGKTSLDLAAQSNHTQAVELLKKCKCHGIGQKIKGLLKK